MTKEEAKLRSSAAVNHARPHATLRATKQGNTSVRWFGDAEERTIVENPTMDLIGQTIGNYQIEAVLGSGGMGQVFRAQHVQLQRAAAFKVLHPQYAADETFRGRFIQEARTAAALVHPNIIEIYDFGQHEDWYYLIMELVEDGSLRSLLHQKNAPSLSVGLDLVRQAAEGLAYAHAQSMVHRDIKPDNLLLKRTTLPVESGNPYSVKISDFGLAKLAEGGMQTVQGQTMGTPAYMSPEQCQALPLDGRSDIYSLGVVLYEVATGTVPFKTSSLSDAVYHHVYVEPPSPRAADPRLSPDLEQIILRCLKKTPAERYASASELARDIQQVTRAMRAGQVAAATAGPSAGPPAAPVSPPEQRTIRLTFERPRQMLTPGEATTVRVAITAPRDSPRQLELDLRDVPANWLPASSATVSLAPGAGQMVSLPVTVPRSPDVRAGDYPVTVRIASPSGDGEPVSAQAIWVVAPYHGIRLDVAPARVSGWSHGRFRVAVTNGGNARAAVALGGHTGDPALTLGLEPALLELDPGETGQAHLTASSKTRWTGGRALGFTVEARGPEQTRESKDAVFAQRSLLPVLAPILALLLIAVVAVGFFLTQGNGAANDALTPTALPTATAPVAAIVPASATSTTTPTPVPTAATSATAAPTPTATSPATTEPTPVASAQAAVPPVEVLGTLPYFVFSTGRGKPPGILEVYRVSADGSHLTALTQNDQDDWEPAVSYDSTQVAFVSTRDGHNQIYVMNADGSNQRRLSNDDASDEFPLWSQAGAFMVYSSTANNRTRLFLIHADGSGLMELAPTPTGSNWSPNWSPMGDEIVFVSDRSGQPNLYAVKADGSDLRQLTSSGADDSPRWSYDGSRILFVSRRDGNREIYVMNKDGSDQTRLTNTPVDEIDPTWSPDDGRIAFAAGGEVFMMQADGSQRTTLTNGADYDSWLGWSPEGKYLAFTSNRDGNREIYVMQADGSDLKRLTDNPGFDGNPTWAPSLP
jgi:Tol biopolymer transport system component/serine/threonine protein kinase